MKTYNKSGSNLLPHLTGLEESQTRTEKNGTKLHIYYSPQPPTSRWNEVVYG